MDKMKVHELAKVLEMTSKEIISKAEELKIEVKSHMSSLTEEDVSKIKKALGKSVKEQPKKEAKKESKTKKIGNDAPVIIRREVIVSEEEIAQKEQEEKKRKQQERKNNVGFIERDKNKDYNIVYRNKPNKPLTVEELFGIKKKEEPKKEMKKEEIKQNESEPMVELQEKKVEEPVKVVEEKEVTPVSQKEEIKEDVSKEKETPVVVEKENKPVNNWGHNNQNNNYANRNNNQGGFNRNNNQSGGFNRNNYGNNQTGNNFGNRNGQNNNFNRNNNQGNNFNRNGQTNNYANRNNNQSGGFNRNNGQNGGFNRNNNNSQGGFNRNNNQNGYNNNQGGFNRGRRPLDEKGLEKNIKNIMASDVIEKEPVREYNKAIDKQKSTRYEENKNTKKASRNRKSEDFDINEGKLKDLKQENRLSNMFNEQDGGMLDYYDLTTVRGKRNRKKVPKSSQEESKQKIFKLTEITIPETISVKDLAAELKKTSGEIIKKLFGYGIMATINNSVDFDTAYLVAGEFGVTANKKEEIKEEDILFDESEDDEAELESRPPVVVVMGHVDHGKTSLLDAIRSTNVIEGEAGGITQHIGAYQVNVNGREITFLDTPGHEAFTSMRARGAQITDVAILVVAADDGVMPQTVEAINHAKSAGIPIIVAVNKIDLPGANIEKIKEELMKYELVPEEWGGETIYVPISAKKRQNIEQLLEMVLLQADMLELKVNPKKQAKGAVMEARLDKAKGPIASLLVQRGRLDVGDTIVVGSSIGRIRAMKNDKGQRVKSAGPSTPVEVMGLTEMPVAGDIFYEVKDEKMAKHLIDRRKRQERESSINATSKVTLNDLFNQIEEGKLKQLDLIIKADVQGTVEAVKQSMEKLSNEEVKVKVIHAAAGAVTESDVTLAKVSHAIIIAFNVRPVPTAKDLADKEEVEIKQYSIIYKAIEDVQDAMKGMLDPEFEEKVIGTVEVRQTFKVSNVGTIAGGYVLTGKVERNAGVRVIREEVVIHEGKLSSLKRFKDDAKEVAKGYECGLQIEGYNDIKEGDIIEVYVMQEIKK